MPPPFLAVFPREIRDQILTYVLANSNGDVRLFPWTVDVARSLSVLRTCKQIHRECKDIIWEHNKLNVRDPSQLFQRLKSQSGLSRTKRIQHVQIFLELLDRDELEWMRASLKGLATWSQIGNLRSITLVTNSDRPRTMEEFQEALVMRESGETIDGRLYRESLTRTKMLVNTGWPRFSHWGKQNWLRAMLLESSGINELASEIHEVFGGDLLVNGSLYLRNRVLVGPKLGVNPQDGEIKIVLPRQPRKRL